MTRCLLSTDPGNAAFREKNFKLKMSSCSSSDEGSYLTVLFSTAKPSAQASRQAGRQAGRRTGDGVLNNGSHGERLSVRPSVLSSVRPSVGRPVCLSGPLFSPFHNSSLGKVRATKRENANG